MQIQGNTREPEIRKKHWQIIRSINPKERHLKIDKLDLEIISLMVNSVSENAAIARQIGKPLSTVQRRTRQLIEKHFVVQRIEPDFKALTFKRALIVISLNGADPIAICNKLVQLDGIIHASAYIGTVDVLALAIFDDSKAMLELLSRVRKIEGVRHVTWSEEVYSVPCP